LRLIYLLCAVYLPFFPIDPPLITFVEQGKHM